MIVLAAADPRLRYDAPVPVDRGRDEIRCERFPRAASDAVAGQIGPLANLRSSSGCSVALTTDSPWVELHLARLRHHQSCPVGIDAEITGADGSAHVSCSTDLRPVQGEVAVRLATGLERGRIPATVRLHLPLISTCAIQGIAVAEGAQVLLPPDPTVPRWLAIGDSLTQGFSVQQPTRHWLHLVSCRLGLPVRNLGVGGLRIEPDVFASALAERPYDLVTINLGSNHAWRDGDPERVAERALALAECARAAGHGRVAWFEPPWKPLEEGLGPPEFLGVPLDRRAAERVAVIRQELAAALDGRVELLRIAWPRDHRLLPDGLHPHGLGMAQIADAVVAALAAGA